MVIPLTEIDYKKLGHLDPWNRLTAVREEAGGGTG